MTKSTRTVFHLSCEQGRRKEEEEEEQTSKTKTRNLEAPAVLHITGTSGVRKCERVHVCAMVMSSEAAEAAFLRVKFTIPLDQYERSEWQEEKEGIK